MKSKSILHLDASGITLVEVMVALVVLLLVMMGLMQSALLSIENNVRNSLRDEAIKVADELMSQLRNLPFDDAAIQATGGYVDSGPVTRKLRNLTDPGVVFIRMRNITDIGADTKRVQVVVGWDYRLEKSPQIPTGKEFQHSLATLRRRR